MARNCIIPIPKRYVKKLLDSVGYKKNIIGKKILENSCGEGKILIEIVCRYIKDAQNKGLSSYDIKRGLERDIIGVEVDHSLIQICIANLDKAIKKYNLPKINWNIQNVDYLTAIFEEIDFIVSNPPYINYHDLSINERIYLSTTFQSCIKGRFDYYYAFVEKGIKELVDGGKFSFLIPYSFLKNKYSNNLRLLVLQHLLKIYDLSNEMVFKDVQISTIILNGCKNKKKDSFYYFQNDKQFLLNKVELQEEQWTFFVNNTQGRRIGDFFRISNSIATLNNKVFIIKISGKDSRYCYVDDIKLEKGLLYDVVSNRLNSSVDKFKIVFPYELYNNKFTLIEETRLKEQYPNIYKYLLNHKETLLKRTISKETQWYEYGRSQAIQSINKNKLIMPNVLSLNFKTFLCQTNTVPVAGYYAVTKDASILSLEILQKILSSKEFKEYIVNNGTPVSNKSYRLSTKLIEDFVFDVDSFIEL